MTTAKPANPGLASAHGEHVNRRFNMKQFEYRLVDMPLTPGSTLEVEDFLNRHGDEGWELVATDYGCFIFKREVQEQTKPHVYENTITIDGTADFQSLDLKPGAP